MAVPADSLRDESDAADRPCVLIAEDDADFRRVLHRYLKTAGYAVVEVNNGEAVFDTMSSTAQSPRALRPDLIVMDALMPGFSGFDVAIGLKLAGYKVPIVFISSFGRKALSPLLLDIGGVAILEKPFSLDELVKVIREALER
jgi:DNA-binding response OmpR family regulator